MYLWVEQNQLNIYHIFVSTPSFVIKCETIKTAIAWKVRIFWGMDILMFGYTTRQTKIWFRNSWNRLKKGSSLLIAGLFAAARGMVPLTEYNTRRHIARASHSSGEPTKLYFRTFYTNLAHGNLF